MKPYRHTVQYYETDRMGITHHSNYIRWMEEARVDFLAQIGWDYARLEEMGVISPVIGIECKYATATTFADVVEISVEVEALKGVRLRLRYVMTNQHGKTVCEGHSEHCFVNEEGRPIRLKREQPEFYEVLSEMAQG
ncbi:thioesterase family protein [Eubacterium sp. AB3007]|uniref:acyl-CoA thioesterase n=1 Tax=Eubacterium sp. AB3007 TaxID=1392487 RepID=UPI00047F47FB|nr:acyl-CoA thioesterase [Eubacterium sp. AB3007]